MALSTLILDRQLCGAQRWKNKTKFTRSAFTLFDKFDVSSLLELPQAKGREKVLSRLQLEQE